MTIDFNILKIAIPYIIENKNKIFIVKLAGDLCEPGEALDNVCEQVSLLYQLGIKIILVHGGKEQASNLAKNLEVESEFVDGRRITNQEMIKVVQMAFAGKVSTDIVASFKKFGTPAIGITGIDTNLIHAVKRPKKEIDFGFVGDVVSVNINLINNLFENNYLPVVTPLVADENGQVLNINADTVATTLASKIAAAKYITLTNIDGVMTDVNDPSSLISLLDINEAKELIKNGTAQGGMIPKITNCIEALEGGVPRVHIVNGLAENALLKEIFTNEGSGTMIVRGK